MLELFDLAPNFTTDQLKESYKRLLLRQFPDGKINPNHPMYKMLADCYKTLTQQLQARKVVASQPAVTPTKKQVAISQRQRFNIDQFNKLFDQFKIKDVHEDGHTDWMANEKSFKEKSSHAREFKDNPQPFVVGSSDIDFYELGVGKIKDHTHMQKNLEYMDYRVAHTTDKIVDPEYVKSRKEYRNIQELEADRANVSHKMSPQEYNEYLKYIKRQKAEEAQRVLIQKKKDDMIAAQYKNISKMPMFQSLKSD